MRTLNQFLLVGALAGALWASGVEGSIRVQVVRADDDRPIVGATIKIQNKSGVGDIKELVSDDKGEVFLEGFEVGDYYVEIGHPEYGGDRSLVKVSEGQETLVKTLLDPAGQERVLKFKANRQLVKVDDPIGGPVTRRDAEFVKRQLADRSLQATLATVPGTSNNSLGQVHARGDHKSATFAVDGVALPMATSSSTTPLIDPDFFDTLSVRTGGYDGSQPGQSGLYMDAGGDWGPSKPYLELRPRVGTQNTYEMLMKIGGASEDGSIDYFIGAKTNTTDLQFEPPHPNQQTLDNRGQATNLMLRLRSRGPEDQVGFTLLHQAGRYGVPQTPQNFAAGVRQNQVDKNTAGILSWKRQIDENLDLKLSLTYLSTQQRINNNGVFTAFTPFDPLISPGLAAEGLPADPLNPGAPYLPTTTTDIGQFQPALRYTETIGKQKIVAGLDFNIISSSQSVDIIDAGGGGGLPDGAGRYTADIRRDGFSGGAYFSHTFPAAERFMVNYGARLERFNNGLGVNTGQVSPFLHLSYAVTEDSALRFSYNRMFQAPPLEVGMAFQTAILPQRVHMMELSYEKQLARNFTGRLALVRKDFRDQVDIAQLIPIANIPIYAPVNFGSASYDGIELSLQSSNKTGWNGFLASTVSWAKPNSPGLFTPDIPVYNDHDQRLQLTAGASYTWDNGLTAAADVFYGSGYPLDAMALYQASGVFPYGITSDRQSRFLTNLSLNYWPKQGEGVEFGGGLQVLNLFDQRSLLNFYSDFSGTRFVPQRRIMLNGMFRF